MARGFGSFEQDELQKFLERVAAACNNATRVTGVPLFLSYGGLLGAVRNGRLIKYDFDIDVIFHCAENEVQDTCQKLSAYLVNQGSRLVPESNGQFKASIVIDGKMVQFEFFAGWATAGKYYQYFAVPGTVSESDILPLGEVLLEGVRFPAPRNPEVLLEAIYGPNWRSPDPNFRYQLSSKDWEPFKFLFFSNMKKFWEDYYSAPETQKVFVSDPSPFAELTLDTIENPARIADFGCGNGRDSIFFARNGHSVFSVDYSDSAISHVCKAAESESLSLETATLNIANIPQVAEFAMKYLESRDIVYARFFTHAISDIGLSNFVNLAKGMLVPGGEMRIEYRSRPDDVSEEAYAASLSYANGDHFRRLRSRPEMEEFFMGVGFTIVESLSSHGLAVWKDEDPLIGRLIIRKDLKLESRAR